MPIGVLAGSESRVNAAPVQLPPPEIAVAILVLALAGILGYAYLRENRPGRSGSTSEERPSPAGAKAESSLSDEDLVRRWLEEADGQLPQKAITERSDWSKSKVSRVLSRMAETGTVEKIRLGRENLIKLNDQDATDTNEDVTGTDQDATNTDGDATDTDGTDVNRS